MRLFRAFTTIAKTAYAFVRTISCFQYVLSKSTNNRLPCFGLIEENMDLSRILVRDNSNAHNKIDERSLAFL